MSVFGVLLPVMKSQAPGWVSLSPPPNLVSEPFAGSSSTPTDAAMSCQSDCPLGPVAWLPSSPAKQLNGSEQAANAVLVPAIANSTTIAVTSNIDKRVLLIGLVERMTPPFGFGYGDFFGS